MKKLRDITASELNAITIISGGLTYQDAVKSTDDLPDSDEVHTARVIAPDGEDGVSLVAVKLAEEWVNANFGFAPASVIHSWSEYPKLQARIEELEAKVEQLEDALKAAHNRLLGLEGW